MSWFDKPEQVTSQRGNRSVLITYFMTHYNILGKTLI